MPFFSRSKTQPAPPASVPTVVIPTPIENDPGREIPPADPAVERRILEIGAEYLDLARGGKAGLLNAAFWSDKLMDWAMQDEAFKVQLFRFVDAFPMLRTPEQIHEHLVDYLSQDRKSVV